MLMPCQHLIRTNVRRLKLRRALCVVKPLFQQFAPRCGNTMCSLFSCADSFGHACHVSILSRCTPGRNRTFDPPLRRRLLLSAELQGLGTGRSRSSSPFKRRDNPGGCSATMSTRSRVHSPLGQVPDLGNRRTHVYWAVNPHHALPRITVSHRKRCSQRVTTIRWTHRRIRRLRR